MNFRSFRRGGVHPDECKSATASLAIENAASPSRVTILLNQHIGTPAVPLVKVGELVRVGQPIGRPDGKLSVAVHASVSGKVVSIGPAARPTWKAGMGVTIESDGMLETHDTVVPRDTSALSGPELVDVMRDCGIVGMGGAAFPTHVKYNLRPGKRAEVIALNGAECEPYLTCDHRVMLENADGVVAGLELLMRAAGASRGVICIESNKPDAIDAISAAIARSAPTSSASGSMQVVPLCTRFPQGEERLLIQAALGMEVPSGGLPIDVGVIVDNVATALAVYDCVRTGMPLVERVVTVTGGVRQPRNLRARIGTSFAELIEACGGFTATPGKIVSGGPMTGLTVHTASVPVTKGTSGIFVIPRDRAAQPKSSACIKCARCVAACPYSLMPVFLAAYSRADMLDEAQATHIADCKECGCCSYVCPSKIDLVQNIRMGKAAIARRRQEKA